MERQKLLIEILDRPRHPSRSADVRALLEHVARRPGRLGRVTARREWGSAVAEAVRRAQRRRSSG